MADAEILLESYNNQWPEMFAKEQTFLADLLAPWVYGSIEHVGSTAVVGLVAKPVIDIMVGVESLALSKPAIEVMSDNGYCYYPYKADVMHWFCKPRPEFRTHHLHLIPFQSPLWLQRIAFRDHLRSCPQDAKAYGELKRQLAEKHMDDRELYTQKKWPFIKQVLDKLEG